MNLAQLALKNGGIIKPLILPSLETGGMGIMNPSIFIDNGKILLNIRVLNYILYHSESQSFYHIYGPLQYIHPEADPYLKTFNFLATLDQNLDIDWHSKIDTSRFDKPPIWEFVGLEDARIFKVENKLYLCGVRRDTTPNGEGRMELSEVEIIDGKAIEVSRQRIPAPGSNTSYCEKNWAIVLDKEPFTFVKWHHPTEVVQYRDGKTIQKSLTASKFFYGMDLRGGSQVVPYNDGYLSLVHETYLFKSDLGCKNARYRHRWVKYDKDLNVTHVSSKPFSFLDAEIEFCAGLAIYEGNVYITFGFQDNSAYIIKMPVGCIDDPKFN